MRSVMALVVGGLVLMTACKQEKASSPAPEQPKPAVAPAPAKASIASDREFEATGIALVEQLLAIFKATATDCELRTTRLNTFMDARDSEIKALNAYAETHPDADAALDSKIDPIMKSVMDHYAITPGAKSCDDHSGFLAAMERAP